MNLTKSIVNHEDASAIVLEHEEIINKLVQENIADIMNADYGLVSQDLENFVQEDNLLETYNNISFFVEHDIISFLDSTSVILSDTDMSLEDKQEILSDLDYSDLDYSEEMKTPRMSKKTRAVRAAVGGVTAGALTGTYRHGSNIMNSPSYKFANFLRGNPAAGAKASKFSTAVKPFVVGAKNIGHTLANKAALKGAAAKAALVAHPVAAGVAGVAGGAALGYGAYKGAKALKNYLAKRKAMKK